MALPVDGRRVVGAVEEFCGSQRNSVEHHPARANANARRVRVGLWDSPTSSSYFTMLGSNSMRTASAWSVVPVHTVL